LSAAVVLSLVTALSAYGEDWAEKMFSVSTHDFGQVARNAKAEFVFPLNNPYLEDAHIVSAQPSCGCTATRIDNPWLKTYQHGGVVAMLNTKSYHGQRGATITVTFDRPYYATAQLRVQGYIRDDVVLDPEEVEFGRVDLGTPAVKRVVVSFSSSSGWEIRDVKTNNPHLSATITPISRNDTSVAYQMDVRLDSATPPGYFQDHLRLVTNDQQNTQFPVLVEGRVVAAVSVSPNSLFLGVLRPGETVTKQLVVKGKKPFRVTSVTAQGKSVTVPPVTDNEEKSLHLIPVTFVARDLPGQGIETLQIKTDLDDNVAELAAYVVVAPLQTARK
jgi:hypothetical protein